MLQMKIGWSQYAGEIGDRARSIVRAGAALEESMSLSKNATVGMYSRGPLWRVDSRTLRLIVVGRNRSRRQIHTGFDCPGTRKLDIQFQAEDKSQGTVDQGAATRTVQWLPTWSYAEGLTRVEWHSSLATILDKSDLVDFCLWPDLTGVEHLWNT